MLFSIVLSISVVLILLFITTPKKLHFFEIIFLYIMIIFFYRNASAILTVNYEVIKLTKQFNLFLILELIKFIFVPLLIIWAIDMYVRLNRNLAKLILIVVLSLLLAYIEKIAESVKVLNYIHWSFLASTAVFALITLISIAAWKIFRYILQKEVVLK